MKTSSSPKKSWRQVTCEAKTHKENYQAWLREPADTAISCVGMSSGAASEPKLWKYVDAEHVFVSTILAEFAT